MLGNLACLVRGGAVGKVSQLFYLFNDLLFFEQVIGITRWLSTLQRAVFLLPLVQSVFKHFTHKLI